MFYHRCDACFCSEQHIFTTQPKTVVSNGLLWVLSTHTAIFIIVSRRVFIFHIILREGERTSMLYVLSLSLSPSLSLALSRSLSLSRLKEAGSESCCAPPSNPSHLIRHPLLLFWADRRVFVVWRKRDEGGVGRGSGNGIIRPENSI